MAASLTIRWIGKGWTIKKQFEFRRLTGTCLESSPPWSGRSSRSISFPVASVRRTCAWGPSWWTTRVLSCATSSSIPSQPVRALPRRPGWSFWWSQVPLAAAIALLAVVGYQNLRVLPEYRRQLAENVGAEVPPHFNVRPAVRGAVPVVQLPEGTRFFEIRAEEVEPAAGGYDCVIQDTQRNVVAKLRAPPIETGDKLNILLDTRQKAP